tara:strand:+ start:122 stop:607 length:486 start_codon:yes stop_codon:yes gene_type:complete
MKTKKDLCSECGQEIKKEKKNEIELARANRQAVDVLSKILGISEEEAKIKLEEKGREHTPVANQGSVMAEIFIKISQILDREIHSGVVNRRSEPWVKEFSDRHITVAGWMKANDMRIALLKTKNAFIYVGFGVIMSRVSTKNSLGEVYQFIYLDQMHKALK